MKKRLVTASLAGLLGVVLAASSALAAPPYITDTNPGATYNKRFIALEVYNPATGINADNVPFYVHTNASIITGAAVNIQATNAQINEGAGQLFLAAPIASINQSAACSAVLPVPASGYYLIGESVAQGVVPLATIAIYNNDQFCVRNGGVSANDAPGTISILPSTYVATEIGTVNTITQIASTTVKEAINLAVAPNLGPTCSIKPLISLAYITNQETVSPTAVLQIIPQIVGYSNANALNATLDTDNDFKSFSLPPAANEPNVTGLDTITTAIGSSVAPVPVVTLIDQQTQGIFTSPTLPLGATGLFDAFVAPTAATSLTIALTSAAAEPGVGITYRANGLTNTGNTWTIVPNDVDTLLNITNLNSRPLILTNNSTVEMNPTSWTITNFALLVNGFATCVAPLPDVGSWAGGLEAYVPFVKSTTGYETFIKISNRYGKPAKLFIAAMNPNTNSVITSTQQLSAPKDAIPTNGQVGISGADLVNAGIITADMAAQGTPIKFLIRVPQQIVTLTNDPYITGVVVTTTPTTQRSQNIDFKWLKNGGLGVH